MQCDVMQQRATSFLQDDYNICNQVINLFILLFEQERKWIHFRYRNQGDRYNRISTLQEQQDVCSHQE